MSSQTAALYFNQVAHAIVRMDDRLFNFFNVMRSTNNTFTIDWSIVIDILGTPELHDYKIACNYKITRLHATTRLQDCMQLQDYKIACNYKITRLHATTRLQDCMQLQDYKIACNYKITRLHATTRLQEHADIARIHGTNNVKTI